MDASAPNMLRWPTGVSLLMGVGAQKSGTTWLHQTLSRHPNCRAFPIKEVHYFDTVTNLTRAGYVLMFKRLKALSARGDAAGEVAKVSRLVDLVEKPGGNDQGYIDLMTEGLAPGSVALDITPAYGMLDDAGFARAASLGATRFLFILREPVARFWSGVRMMAKLTGDAADPVEIAAREIADEALSASGGPRLEAMVARGDYATTLDRLQRHVPAHRRLVVFFEDLFTQATLDRICAFLGLSPMPLTDTSPRLEGVSATLRPDQIERATEFFRPQYEAVCAALGDAVPAAWHERFARGSVAA
ncbi:sulfotransferase family protein [Pararhodobacter zhoushanensis]|uniref:sulfotransferase family protein n=1 Tax=Pararhodobacter zhoushanensis TaxID=2479545 RepID=UPI000F8D5827|nr:sulfotransferase [Pararhodobacter zhoushanensis]